MRKLLSPLLLITNLLTLAPGVGASPLPLHVSVQRQGGETYDQFIQRANQLAQKTISQSFQQDTTLEAVNVVVIGENDGAIAPLLNVRVSRAQWQTAPQVARWGAELPFSKSLLGLEAPPPAPQTTPNPTPAEPPPTDAAPPSSSGLPISDPLPDPPEPLPISEERLRVGRPFREQRQEEFENQP